MRFLPEHANVLKKLITDHLASHQTAEEQMQAIWIAMAQVKGMELSKKLALTCNDTVMKGPFKGLQLTKAAMTKLYGYYLSGSYENELHPYLEDFISQPYQIILNIGSSLGYYAAGLAMRMPQAVVHAFDIDPKEQDRCRGMAAQNNVADRVIVSGLFRGEDFVQYAAQKTLIVMDIEGGEVALLDPVAYPALTSMDIIVELHDVLEPDISEKVMERFKTSHDIKFVPNTVNLFDFTPYVGKGYVDPFESLLMNWENRTGPTPWAVMTARNPSI